MMRYGNRSMGALRTFRLLIAFDASRRLGVPLYALERFGEAVKHLVAEPLALALVPAPRFSDFLLRHLVEADGLLPLHERGARRMRSSTTLQSSSGPPLP